MFLQASVYQWVMWSGIQQGKYTRSSFLGFMLGLHTTAVTASNRHLWHLHRKGGLLIIGLCPNLFGTQGWVSAHSYSTYDSPSAFQDYWEEFKSEERQTLKLVWEGLWKHIALMKVGPRGNILAIKDAVPELLCHFRFRCFIGNWTTKRIDPIRHTFQKKQLLSGNLSSQWAKGGRFPLEKQMRTNRNTHRI